MADFTMAFEITISREGGYVLMTTSGDRGGQTFAGISRKHWPSWSGWEYVDIGDLDAAKTLVRHFYRQHFWEKICGDDIRSQPIANQIYDHAVNCGVKSAVQSVQAVVGATPDGVIGPVTLTALNAWSNTAFFPAYALHRIKHYAGIVSHDKSQLKFLLGWINRALA